MNDQSLMPFGKHKGEKMEDVPAGYLLWLWCDGIRTGSGDLHNYIKENLQVLQKECPDFIIGD